MYSLHSIPGCTSLAMSEVTRVLPACLPPALPCPAPPPLAPNTVRCCRHLFDVISFVSRMHALGVHTTVEAPPSAVTSVMHLSESDGHDHMAALTTTYANKEHLK